MFILRAMPGSATVEALDLEVASFGVTSISAFKASVESPSWKIPPATRQIFLSKGSSVIMLCYYDPAEDGKLKEMVENGNGEFDEVTKFDGIEFYEPASSVMSSWVTPSAWPSTFPPLDGFTVFFDCYISGGKYTDCDMS